VVADLVSTAMLTFSSNLTRALGMPGKDKEAYCRKTVHLLLNYGGEVNSAHGVTMQEGVRYRYPGPIVRSLGDFCLSHYRLSNDTRKHKKKENLLYTKLIIHGFPKYEYIVQICKTLLLGFYINHLDVKGFRAALKNYFPNTIRDSICLLHRMKISATTKCGVTEAKILIPWNIELFQSKFPKTWYRLTRVDRVILTFMEKEAKYV